MLLSRYFLPVLKEKPLESQITSHTLMIRSGMIKQQVAGIYTWLPLGLKLLKKIEKIIRHHMDAIYGIELLMPITQSTDLWIESGRLNDYGPEMLKFDDRHNNTLLFGPTNEEVITDIFRKTIKSYKDLPKIFYHIQWKFRDEIRPRFGVMRAREFLMKDAYSFDIDQEGAIISYNKMYAAYMKIFHDLDLAVVPVLADSGAIGGNLSHEFHVIADVGESTIYYDKKFKILSEELAKDIELAQSLYAATDEKHLPKECKIHDKELCVSKGIEVGHIFYFGNKYSEAMNASVNTKDSSLTTVEMGSYGIGISRLVAAIIETHHDDKGIIWPEQIAPFKVSIINLNTNDDQSNNLAQYAYNFLQAANIDVLYDDTNERAGSKFATHDLIGTPWHLIIGSKKAKNNIVELKHRGSGELEELSLENALEKLI